MNQLARWAPMVLSLLRIVAALLFLQHGLMKLWHFPGPQPGAPTPLPPLLLTAAWIEVVGGVLIALGLFTRHAAFICSGQMAVAYYMAHHSKSVWPALNGGEPAVFYCFVFFYLVFAGPGPLSLDAARGRR